MNQSINQSIITNLYSAISRVRIGVWNVVKSIQYRLRQTGNRFFAACDRLVTFIIAISHSVVTEYRPSEKCIL